MSFKRGTSLFPRTGRRDMLRYLGLGTAGAIAVACGGGDSNKSNTGGSGAASTTTSGAGSPAAAGQPKRGGTFRYVWQGTSHLDVHQDSISGAQNIVSAVYDRLLRFQDKEQIPEPDLAA